MSNQAEESPPEEHCEEDAHLPRVRIELDRLNYANESINNLEVEFEESKREFLQTMRDADQVLMKLEKKFSGHVSKVVPYYEQRVNVNLSKQKYLQAKFEFETAQELYVAAKNLQMYAEENLENTGEGERAELERMLKMSRVKVCERELTKQSSDLQQIEAFKVYDDQSKQLSQTEKKLKTSISKSLNYFQLKSGFNKELKFFHVKTEALKSCLREAKTTYQQSLTNLEKISTEVHEQRNNNKKVSNSSPNLGTLEEEVLKSPRSKSNNVLSKLDSEQDVQSEELEDYDTYFKDEHLKNELDKGNGSNRIVIHMKDNAANNSNSVCSLTDEEIEYLSLDGQLRKFGMDLMGGNSNGNGKHQKKVIEEIPKVNKITVPQLSRTKYM